MTIQEIMPMPTPVQSQEKSVESHSDQGDFFDLIQQASADQSNSPELNGDVSKVPLDKPNKPIKKADKDHKPVDLMDLTEQALASNVMQQTPQKPNLSETVGKQAKLIDKQAKLIDKQEKPVTSTLLSELKQIVKPQSSPTLSGDLLKSMSLDQQKDVAKIQQVTQSISLPDNLKLSEAMQVLQSNKVEESDIKLPISQPMENKESSASVSTILNSQDKILHQNVADKSIKQQPVDFNNAMQSQAISITDATQATQVSQANITATHHNETGKITQSLSELGTVIQSQVTAAMPNNAPTVANTVTINPTVSVDTILQAKKSDYEMNVETFHDLSPTHINDSYIANIKIYPPELGNVLAKLKVDKSSAQLVIVTESERVKNIVEANLPQLKEHFLQSNLTLTHIQVQSASAGMSDQNQGRSHQHAEFMPDSEGARARTQSGLADVPKDPQKIGNKIIDTYA